MGPGTAPSGCRWQDSLARMENRLTVSNCRVSTPLTKAGDRVINQILTIVGSTASVLALIVSFGIIRPLSPLQVGLLVVGTSCGAVAIGSAVREYRRSSQRVCKSEHDIAEYMHRWINQDGRAAVFSRNMTWASRPRLRALLLQKALNKELVLILPQPTDLSEELRGHGAEVVYYPRLNYSPMSRFTIVRLGREDARVAVGRTVKGRHTISEYSMGEHSAYAMAQDLVNILLRLDDQ